MSNWRTSSQRIPKRGEDSAIQEIKYKVTFYGFAYAFIDEQGFEAELRDSPDVNMEKQSGTGSWWDELPKVVSPDMKAVIKNLEPMLMTQFEIDSLFHGKSFLHFKGRIKYHDFSDIPRETTVWQLWKTLGPKKGRSTAGGTGYWQRIGATRGQSQYLTPIGKLGNYRGVSPVLRLPFRLPTKRREAVDPTGFEPAPLSWTG